jgi:hypothetical protein
VENKIFGIWRLLLIAAILLIGGCSNLSRGDSRTAREIESYGQFASINLQTHTPEEYSSHCDEGTRERQHELANCTAVPLIVMPLEPGS